jgi:hypothetical protein
VPSKVFRSLGLILIDTGPKCAPALKSATDQQMSTA